MRLAWWPPLTGVDGVLCALFQEEGWDPSLVVSGLEPGSVPTTMEIQSANGQRATIPHPESLVCPICLCMARSPTVTPCGHLFCRGCLANALCISQRCPLCRRVTSLMECMGEHAQIRAAPYARLVQSLRVRCIHWNYEPCPCSWVGTLASTANHLARCTVGYCPYKPYGCTFRGTPQQVMEHERESAAQHFKGMRDALRAKDQQTKRLANAVVLLHEVRPLCVPLPGQMGLAAESEA